MAPPPARTVAITPAITERTAADSPSRAQSADSIDYTYRETEPPTGRWPCSGTSSGTSTNGTPALADALATARRITTVDNAGGEATGTACVLVDRPPPRLPFVGFASYADSSQPPQLCGFEVSRDLPSHLGCDLAGEAEVDAAVYAGVDDLGHAGGEAGQGARDAGHAG